MKNLLLLWSVCFRLLVPETLYAQDAPLPDPALPGGRHALVIGNGDYGRISLAAPVENARLMADALRAKGFAVTYLENAPVKSMKAAMRSFANRLSASVGVVYYAGHSLSVDGKIFLVPVDARLDTVSAVEYECVDLGYLTQKVDRNPMNLIVLETGTDRRFQSLWPQYQQTQPILFPAMENTVVVTATDLTQQIGKDQFSQGVFTRELIRRMQEPGLPARVALELTVAEVQAQSGGLQRPVVSGQAVAFFRFTPEPVLLPFTAREPQRRRVHPER